MSEPDEIVLAELKRETAMRKKVYPRWIQDGRISQPNADRRIAIMEQLAAEIEGRIRRRTGDLFAEVEDGCELCGDQDVPLHIHARCHPTAPLRLEIEDGKLRAFCYVPECNRAVGEWQLG